MIRAASSTQLGIPPLPREHGAWAMLLAPPLAVAVGLGAPVGGSVLLLAALVVALFAQQAAVKALRAPSVRANAVSWLAVELGLLTLAALVFVAGMGLTDLLLVGAAGIAWAAIYLQLRSRRGARMDRNVGVELLSVAALTLGAPAAWIVATGSFDLGALGAWGVSIAFFAGSVFFVHALVVARRGARAKGGAPAGHPAVPSVAFHAVLAGVGGWLAWDLGGTLGVYLVVALVPCVVRGLAAPLVIRWPGATVTRVGVAEAALTVWASTWGALALDLISGGPA